VSTPPDAKTAAPGPTKAMVLAAGLGTRMRPLTDDKPKPLIAVDGRALIDHMLDRLEEAGVTDAVVNVFHLAEQLERHLAGVKNALHLFGDEPFYVANSDALLLNGPHPILPRLVSCWDDDKMDGLLLLHSTVEAFGYVGNGDFCADPDGQLTRRPEMEVAPWLFTGVQILHPRLFEGTPDSAFSLNVVYDKAIEAGRLYGVMHDGEWFHVGTPDGLAEAEDYMSERFAGRTYR